MVRHIWGFTATRERPDKMHSICDLFLGPVVLEDLTPLRVAKYVDVVPVLFTEGRRKRVTKRGMKVGTLVTDALASKHCLPHDERRTDLLIRIGLEASEHKGKTIVFCELIKLFLIPYSAGTGSNCIRPPRFAISVRIRTRRLGKRSM